MAKPAVTLSSGHPDPKVLRTLTFVRRVSVLAIASVNAVTLIAWAFPIVGSLLPAGWHLLKANAALCILALCCSVQLSRLKRSRTHQLLSKGIALAVALLSCATLYENLHGVDLHIDTLLAPDPASTLPGRMDPHAAIALLTLAVIALIVRARKSLLSYIADALAVAVVLFMVIISSGYFYGVISSSDATPRSVAPHAIASLFLLSIIVFNERAHFGIFAIFTADSIAGKTARLAAPFALSLPFLMELLRNGVLRSSMFRHQYATTLAASTMALLAFCLIYIMSRRIQALESEIHDLSLRDELTGLYNRRGFYVLASQALRLAQRLRAPYSVIFIDVDNLKPINDTFGHEAGSELLKEISSILVTNFREIDIIGRLGGDEFVVAVSAGLGELALVIQRLEAATDSANSTPGRACRISFSYGHATSQIGLHQTLDDLLSEADSRMYQTKRSKRTVENDPIPRASHNILPPRTA